jgi:hypothetical protein
MDETTMQSEKTIVHAPYGEKVGAGDTAAHLMPSATHSRSLA